MRAVKPTVSRAYKALDNIFSDKEAWDLFRIAAIVETIGWTLLIFGIISIYTIIPIGKLYILPIAGSIHGIFYIFYLFIVIFSHRSLKWSVWRFVFAELISVVPYGALVFEQFVAHERRKRATPLVKINHNRHTKP